MTFFFLVITHLAGADDLFFLMTHLAEAEDFFLPSLSKYPSAAPAKKIMTILIVIIFKQNRFKSYENGWKEINLTKMR